MRQFPAPPRDLRWEGPWPCSRPLLTTLLRSRSGFAATPLRPTSPRSPSRKKSPSPTRGSHDEPDERRRVPAHVTVITREEIESSGARTLQDLFTLEAGVVVFDQIGNDVQKSFDLRGFGGAAGTRVFLDGAPMNEPRNNGVSLELVPLQALDRVEITRGSMATLAGGGSEAGAINLWTRHGVESGGAVSAAAGDFETYEGRGSVWHDFDSVDFFLSGASEETDGFRDNADGDLERFQGSLGWDLGPTRPLLALGAR